MSTNTQFHIKIAVGIFIFAANKFRPVLIKMVYAPPISPAAQPQFFFSPPRSWCASFVMPFRSIVIRRAGFGVLGSE
jgi:hypothetical protein